MRVTPDSEAPTWIRKGGAPDEAYTVPQRFTVTIDDGSLDWDVRLVVSGDTATGAFTVDEVTISRRPGEDSPPASAAGIRHVPLGEIVTKAVKLAILPMRVSTNEDGTLKLSHVVGGDQPTAPFAPDPVIRRTVEGRRRNAVTPEMLASALQLYEEAKANGTRNPYGWVADQLGIARSTAHKYVKQARDKQEGDKS